jgi:hypothetical protein
MLLEPAGMISRFVFTQYNLATGVKSSKFPTIVVAMKGCHHSAQSRLELHDTDER